MIGGFQNQVMTVGSKPLWTHLRAWRSHLGLSQAEVGASLGKGHTTIGRWEKGEMKLSTTDLEALAKLYGVSVSQLQMPPEAAELVARMDRAQVILSGLTKEDLEYWIGMGERLLRR